MKKSSSPLNVIWLFMILFAVVFAAYNGKMADMTKVPFESAKTAVNLALGLIGGMALWLGILKVVEAAGLMRAIARAMRPVMIRLFPDVPADHPAMSAILMNIAANALGLGNAATPIGLKAMVELNKLNSQPGTATNAMCLFLAINTSSVVLLPIETINVRATAGATSPANIILPSLIATCCSTAVAITMSKLLSKRSQAPAPILPDVTAPAPESLDLQLDSEGDESEQGSVPGLWGMLVFGGLIVAFIGAIIHRATQHQLSYFISVEFFTHASNWLMPMAICLFLLVGYFRGVKVYEVVTEGAKEGFTTVVRIIPFLVAIIVAIGMFRASGALEWLSDTINPLTSLIGMPAEALPMALIRPLSGGGAFGYMADIINTAPDSFLAYLVSTMQGSTETTFYVLAVYFGSVGISRTRHAVPAALCADAVGLLAALAICQVLYTGA